MYLGHTNTVSFIYVTLTQPEKELHEVVIGSDLSIKKKNLPTDPFYKAVDIKESRRKSSVVPSLDMSME